MLRFHRRFGRVFGHFLLIFTFYKSDRGNALDRTRDLRFGRTFHTNTFTIKDRDGFEDRTLDFFCGLNDETNIRAIQDNGNGFLLRRYVSPACEFDIIRLGSDLTIQL